MSAPVQPVAAPIAAPIAAPGVVPAAPVARQSIEEAIAAARSSAATPTHHSQTQPRDVQTQRFVDPNAAPAAPAVGPDGQPIASVVELGPDGQPVAPDPSATPGDDADGFFPHTLKGDPARGELDEVLELPDTPAVRNWLARTEAGNMRRAEFEDAMSNTLAQRDEAERVILGAELDPVGFIGQYVSPDIEKSYILSKLADPTFLNSIVDELNLLATPEGQRTVASEQRLKLKEKTDEARTNIQIRQQSRQTQAQIKVAFDAIVPKTVRPEQRTFIIDSLNLRLVSAIQNGEVAPQHVTAANLPYILQNDLMAIGISAPEAARLIAEAMQGGQAMQGGRGGPSVTPQPRASSANGRTGPVGGTGPAPSAGVPGSPAQPIGTGNGPVPAPAAVTRETLRALHEQRDRVIQTGVSSNGSPMASDNLAPIVGRKGLEQTIAAARARIRQSA